MGGRVIQLSLTSDEAMCVMGALNVSSVLRVTIAPSPDYPARAGSCVRIDRAALAFGLRQREEHAIAQRALKSPLGQLVKRDRPRSAETTLASSSS